MIKNKILRLSIFLWSLMCANFARADMIMGNEKPSFPLKTLSGYESNISAKDFSDLFFVRFSLGLVVVIICLAVSLLIVSKIKKKK